VKHRRHALTATCLAVANRKKTEPRRQGSAFFTRR
jgi:hypothetical protein